MTDKILEVRGLTKTYGGEKRKGAKQAAPTLDVLRGIDIDIYRGDVVCLIGPSGCGKSTFLKTLNRMNDLVPGIRIEGARQHNDPYSAEIIRSMIRTLAYKVCRIIARHVETGASDASSRSRNEEYFNQFMGVLARHYMQQRSVGFYAGQLNLTPKYLTTIIRKTSGRTAVQWIDDYVVLEAKNLLKYSTMSIQEISYYLNFPNQSFFGKYFKNHTGMTPTAYRLGK